MIPDTIALHIHGYSGLTDALERGELNAVNFGPIRSGTSLVWTILREWFPANTIAKTHAFIPYPALYDSRTVVTYRDFRDAATSAWRRHAAEGQMMTEVEVRHFSNSAHVGAFVLNQYRDNRPSSLFVRYEDDIINIPRLIRKMAERFGVAMTGYEVTAMAERHSIDQHRKEADGIAPRSADAPWMEHHISDGAVGDWRRFVPSRLHGLFTDLLYTELSDWGYVD